MQAEASGTILVVDDDSLVAASTALLLEDMGHAVVAADSGDAALEILQSGAAVDVLLTDYSMPYMSGAELASAARSLRPHLPIILATGYAELPDIDPSVLHLRKPYQREQLLTQVNLALHLCRGT
ncbi:response regulator [Cupriavidus sp. EM10]